MPSWIWFLSGFAAGIGTVFVVNGVSMIAFGKPFLLSTAAENDTAAVRWMGISEVLGGAVSYLAVGMVLLQSGWLVGATLLVTLASVLSRRLGGESPWEWWRL